MTAPRGRERIWIRDCGDTLCFWKFRSEKLLPLPPLFPFPLVRFFFGLVHILCLWSLPHPNLFLILCCLTQWPWKRQKGAVPPSFHVSSTPPLIFNYQGCGSY